MSLDRFIRVTDSLVEFEAAFNDNQLPISSVFSIETHRDELKAIWTQLKEAYETCLADIMNTEEKEAANEDANELETIKEKYKRSYITYCRCISRLNELF